MRHASVLFLLALLVALSAPASSAASPRALTSRPLSSQERPRPADPRTVRTIAAVPVSGPIAVDGVLSESVWQTPGAGGFTQRDPSDGQPASEPTTVWVAFDRDNIYIAARLFDSEPDKITGRLGRRDETTESDLFDVGLDPYHRPRGWSICPSGSYLEPGDRERIRSRRGVC